MIAVVDYGMGNLHSVRHALGMVGADVVLTHDPEELKKAERIVLPGVGAFGECAKNLRASGIVDALREEVISRGKPLLGICVGMQVLATEGHEMGVHAGLDWIAGVVEPLPAPGLRIPHVGWNEIIHDGTHPMLRGVRSGSPLYFVHSYAFVAKDPANVAATCDYGGPFTAALRKDNIFATQFHPEKSQQIGLRVLENFLTWNP